MATTPVFFTRDHGCIGHPAFPAPSLIEGQRFLPPTRARCAARRRRCVRLSYPPLEGEGRRAPATRSVVRKRRGGVAKRLCPELHPTPSSTSLRELLADPPPRGGCSKPAHPCVLATAFRPRFAIHRRPQNKRAQGRPGARCTRGLACQCICKEKRTRAYRFSGSSPAFPAQWLYGLYRALPGETWLACHRHPREA